MQIGLYTVFVRLNMLPALCTVRFQPESLCVIRLLLRQPGVNGHESRRFVRICYPGCVRGTRCAVLKRDEMYAQRSIVPPRQTALHQ